MSQYSRKPLMMNNTYSSKHYRNEHGEYTTVETQASYGIGLQMGQQLAQNPLKVLM